MVTQPFKDIPLEAYSDSRNLNFDKLIKEYIFINLNTICNLPECYSEDDSFVNFMLKNMILLIYLQYYLSILA